MSQPIRDPSHLKALQVRFSSLCSAICVTPGDKDQQRQELIDLILAHPEARPEFAYMIIGSRKATPALAEIARYCIQILQWPEFFPPPRAPEWAVCSECGTEMRIKNFPRHRNHCPARKNRKNSIPTSVAMSRERTEISDEFWKLEAAADAAWRVSIFGQAAPTSYNALVEYVQTQSSHRAELLSCFRELLRRKKPSAQPLFDYCIAHLGWPELQVIQQQAKAVHKISWSSTKPPHRRKNKRSPKKRPHAGHSNGGHPYGGNFTKHYNGYRTGHHRIGSDGKYIY